MLIEQLQYVKKGDILSHDIVNALIDAAKAARHHLGYGDNNTEAQQHKPRAYRVLQCKNTTGGILLPFSVFSIADEDAYTNYQEPPRALAEILGDDPNGSPLLFLTNGSTEIPENAQFEPEMISFDKPTKVRVSDSNPPKIGEQCGVAFDTKTVTSFRYGLVCLTPSWVESGTRYAWVCRSREPIKVIGCVTTRITKSSIVDGMREAGLGFINIQYRDADNILQSVNKPSDPDSLWSIRVYNYTEVEYAVGMLVSATDTLGMGLSVNYEIPNSLCNMSSGSSESG